MEPPKLNKEQLIRLPDSRKHSLVFDWLTKVADFLRQSDGKVIHDKQDGIIQELEILLACNAAPPVRRLASAALSDLFSKGNPFGAYQIINKCNDLLKAKEDSTAPLGKRLFALEVIGKLYLELGRCLGSCFPDTVFSLLKSLKQSESSRVECLNAIRNLLIGLENSAAMKHQEIYKNVRPYLSNHDSAVRSAAALCVSTLAGKYSQLVATTEVEFLFQLSLRQMNEKDSSKSFSLLLANLSVACLDPSIIISGSTPTTNSRKLRKPSRHEVLSYLKMSFLTGSCVQKRKYISKNVSCRAVKMGVAEAHVQFVRIQKSDWLETNLSTFLSHVLSFLMDSRSTANHQDALHCALCIRQIFSQTLDQLLSEKAQLQAIKILGNFISTNVSVVEDDVLTGHALVAAIQAVNSLIDILGSSAAPSLSDMSIINALLGGLIHILPSTRLNSAWCLRQIVTSLPSLLTTILDQLIDRLNDFRTNKNAVEGHSAAIAAILAASNITEPKGIVSGRSIRILQLVSELIKPVQDHTVGLSRVMGAWLIYAALLKAENLIDNEKDAIKDQVVLAIRSCFPQGDVKGAFIKEMILPADKLSQAIEVRSGALLALQLLPKEPELSPLLEQIVRSALEYLNHVDSLLTKYPQLRSTVKFYKMRLYRTLTEMDNILWEYALSTLFKHVVSDLTLAEPNSQIAQSSLLSSLVSTDQADILIDSSDFRFTIIGSLQHSASEILTSALGIPEPYPLQIQLLDAAVTFFGCAFPLAAMKHRAQITQHFIDCLRQTKKEKLLSVQINILSAYAMALKSLGQTKGTVGDDVILKSSAELLLSFVSHHSQAVRCVASSGLGRLAQLHPVLINNLAQISFEKIKEPKSSVEAKSGFCLVLGDLHRYVGTRAKASHIRTTGSILLSLASDARLGMVRNWSTFALSLVVEAVGPNFQSFIEPTLDCALNQLLASDQSQQSIKCLSKLLQALITVSGPELEMDKELLGIVNATLSVLESTDCVDEAILCIQQLQMFVPQYDSLPRILPKICNYLRTESPGLQTVAVGCLRQLSQRNPCQVSLLCENEFEKGIEGKLMELFDVPDGIELNQVKDTLNLLLSARFEEKLTFWMKLVGEVFQASEQRTEDTPDDVETDDDDDEKMTKMESDKKEKPHWRTRVFAGEVLSSLVELCYESGAEKHFDLKIARKHKNQQCLVSFLPDLIRCFFIAATDSNTLLCKNGLKSLKRLIILFKGALDPDVEDSYLLEQYQANIGAALRSAFSSDALPDVSVLASSVASEWLCAGVASSINDIQRVYRLMVSSLDSIRLPSKAPTYAEKSLVIRNRATIEAWAEIFISAVEQSGQKQSKNKEFPPDGMMNLVECEIKDLKHLWCKYLYQETNSVILHAVALLGKPELWRNPEERQIIIQVISSSSVETLLRPASSVPLKTAFHSISAVAAVQHEFSLEHVQDLTYELICTAFRCILTKANESTKIGVKALQLVKTAISNYINLMCKEKFENGTVLKVLLEVITCSITRTFISSHDFLASLISILAMPFDLADEQREIRDMMSCLYIRVLKVIIAIPEDPGDNLALFLGQIKSRFTESKHIELFVNTILQSKDVNVFTTTSILSFLTISFCNILGNMNKTIFEKIQSYLNPSQLYHKHICNLSARAMRVFASQTNQVQMNLLMVIGVEMMNKLNMNELDIDAVPEAVQFFESYATVSSLAGHVIYFRILFLLLQRQTRTSIVLQKFSQAATLYPDAVRCLLATDESLKLLLEKRLTENADAQNQIVNNSNQGAPKIDLKMNFANYAQ